jgi:hypothetical protein
MMVFDEIFENLIFCDVNRRQEKSSGSLKYFRKTQGKWGMFIQAAVHNNMMPGVKKTPPV